jgi:hypothetical protein
LLHPTFIARNRAGLDVENGLDLYAFGICRRTHHVDCSPDHLRQFALDNLQLHLAGNDARHIQHIIDELCLGAAISFDDFHTFLQIGFIVFVRAKNRRPAQDGVERCADLVTQRREKQILGAIGSLGFHARGLLVGQ